MTFDSVEVYVRVADYGYEGESVRFATVNEEQALTFFSRDNEIYAPDGTGEDLRVYVGGKLKETWYRENSKWVTPQYSKNQREYGVIQI